MHIGVTQFLYVAVRKSDKCTVLQDVQFAALSNKYLSLNFLQILMIFCNQNHQFCDILTIFQIKMAKMMIC